jgi:hypothetical protein
MSFKNSREDIHQGTFETDEDIESVITALADEETGMANEIYALAQKLKTALEPSRLEHTDNVELIENLNGLNSSIENTLTSVIKKEIAVIGKIENFLSPNRNN